MGQHQPSFIQFDRRSAIADLHKFPRIFGLHHRHAIIPIIQIFGCDIMQVFIILPRDHGIAAINLAREQRHALVARRFALQRGHLE